MPLLVETLALFLLVFALGLVAGAAIWRRR
ncbi:hypothetical protein HNP60_000195 [Sphingobium sp. B1D3A]|uniref:Uncharacterized protein n=1 Tax=Sphingobium lignivorans TaxID=2735886 RepID=A0ABR6NAC7_9SPHN|nr:hypothetical protein [Sphingobium lignivorans]